MSFDNFVSELSVHSPFAVWSVVFIYGLIIGSFLNVLIYRLPIQILDKETNAKSSRFKFNSICTRSMCPHCASKIAWYHNFPLISWLMLRGRSSCCGKPISIRYPLVELAGGIAPLMVGLWFELDDLIIHYYALGCDRYIRD
ncbi:prepilin peptidase [Photobacterium leiognathi]|uniref:prepilin peptidase n=1 Tax=Photobacterium leiognathi TaxID=553611 RepID=UPI003BF5A22C|nr:prepilin peptidase [Photobacterium leiognathi]